jgi:hypothetical protein
MANASLRQLGSDSKAVMGCGGYMGDTVCPQVNRMSSLNLSTSLELKGC